MNAKDIFKIRKGSLVMGLIGADGEILEVSEVTDLTLRADCVKFRVGFKTTNRKWWSITEKSDVHFINGVKILTDGNFQLTTAGLEWPGHVVFTSMDALIAWENLWRAAK